MVSTLCLSNSDAPSVRLPKTGYAEESSLLGAITEVDGNSRSLEEPIFKNAHSWQFYADFLETFCILLLYLRSANQRCQITKMYRDPAIGLRSAVGGM